MDNILKKISMVIISIFLSVIFIMGGYKLMQQLEYNEMVRIVKSEEVKAIVEED